MLGFPIRLSFYIPFTKGLEKMHDLGLYLYPMAIAFISVAFRCGINTGSPRTESEVNLPKMIYSLCHLIRWPLSLTKADAMFSSIWPSPFITIVPLSVSGPAHLCWLGRCSLWLNKLHSADWESFHWGLVIYFLLFQTQAESGECVSGKLEEEEVSFPSFGRHFWLNAQLGQCAIGIVKTCFGYTLFKPEKLWERVTENSRSFRIIEGSNTSRIHLIFKNREATFFNFTSVKRENLTAQNLLMVKKCLEGSTGTEIYLLLDKEYDVYILILQTWGEL